MKKIFLTALLALIWVMVLANPLGPIFAMRVWFGTDGDFFVEVGINLVDIPAQDFEFTTSSGTYQLPASYAAPDSAGFVLNLTQLIPGFSISPQDDFFRVEQSDNTWYPEQITWNSDNSLSTDIHPLLPGQSAVQFYVDVLDNAFQCWSKDDGVFQDEPFMQYPHSNCFVDVQILNTQGSPVPSYPVYMSYETFAGGMNMYDGWQTDANGLCHMTIYPARLWIKVIDSVNGNQVVDQLFYPEPGETIMLTATVSSVAASDPLNCQIPGVLSVYPNVLNMSKGNTINVIYDETGDLTSQTELILLDIRGRLLQTHSFDPSGVMAWQLPELNSGIYFIALKDGNRQFGRHKLTVFK